MLIHREQKQKEGTGIKEYKWEMIVTNGNMITQSAKSTSKQKSEPREEIKTIQNMGLLVSRTGGNITKISHSEAKATKASIK